MSELQKELLKDVGRKICLGSLSIWFIKGKKKNNDFAGDISESLYFARELSFLYILDSLYIINLWPNIDKWQIRLP